MICVALLANIDRYSFQDAIDVEETSYNPRSIYQRAPTMDKKLTIRELIVYEAAKPQANHIWLRIVAIQSACGYLPLIGLTAQESGNIKVITCILESALRAACGFRLFARFCAIVITVLHHVTPWKIQN